MEPQALLDVAIVGGGLVGAGLAQALAPSGRSVALIEAHAPRPSEPRWDERCIAINDTGVRILSRLGVWPALATQAFTITATHISEQGRFGVTRFHAADAGIAALGYNTPIRALGEVLWRVLAEGPTTLHCPARVTALQARADAVELELDGGAVRLRARLVVAADGGDSVVRALLGIGSRRHAYQQQAIVSAVRVSRGHRDVAYERFTSEGPLAILPKGERACSLVWSVSTARAEVLSAAGNDDFRAQAQAAFGQRLGAFTALGSRFAYPLEQVIASEPVAPRVAFIGNAAQSLHPVAAQGFNLGLRDAAALAHLVGDAPDPGAPALLESFSEGRVRDRRAASASTDLLVRLFSNRLPGLAQARHWGLLALDLAGPLKARVRDQHLGYLGLPPGLVRERST